MNPPRVVRVYERRLRCKPAARAERGKLPHMLVPKPGLPRRVLLTLSVSEFQAQLADLENRHRRRARR